MLKKRFIYVKEYIETIEVTIPISKRKNAAKLSILKIKFMKGILLSILNEITWVLAEINLYIMDKLNKLPAARENMFDKKFDILGLEYVANEESDPVIYNKIHIIKLVVKKFADMNQKPPEQLSRP